MCGIVGLISSHQNGFSKAETDVFTQMLFLDTLRGWDSTGVFGVDRGCNVKIVKDALHGADFISTENYRKFGSEMLTRGIMAIGHNRAATRGSVSDKNAHPFWVEDKVILVQNGTMYGDHKKIKDVDVDSEALAHVLFEEQDIEKALAKIDAAYALCWLDLRKESLFLVRNSQRPMWLGEIGAKHYGRTGWIFASELETITYACAKNKLEIKSAPKEITPHDLHTFTIKEGLVDLEVTKIQPYRRSLPQTFNDSKHPLACGYWDEDGHDAVPSSVSYPRPTSQLNWKERRERNEASIIKNDLVTHIICNEDSYYIPASDFEEAMREANTFFASDREKHCEVVSYVAGNNDPNCTTFHVYGNVILPETSKYTDKILVHWFYYGTEAQVKKYVENTFFSFKSSTVQSQQFRKNNETFYIIKLFGYDTKAFVDVEPTTQS